MSDQPPQGVALGLLDRLLAYASTPWRVVSLIVLAGCGLTLWVGWEYRAQIAESILHSTVHPHLIEEAFPQIAKELISVTGGQIVALVSVQPEANIGRYVTGFDTTNVNWRPPTNSRPLWTATNASYIILVMEGAVVCYDPQLDSPFEVRREIASWGAVRACVVAVPAISDVMVGALLLAWRDVPSSGTELAARQEIRRAALKLAEW